MSSRQLIFITGMEDFSKLSCLLAQSVCQSGRLSRCTISGIITNFSKKMILNLIIIIIDGIHTQIYG